MKAFLFFNRDLSWLSFNGRLLMEAAKPSVPLAERIRFLSIYSSNLDEFYRVRMPVLMAFGKIRIDKDDPLELLDPSTLAGVNTVIREQLKCFGNLLVGDLIPALKANDTYLVYNEPIPATIGKDVFGYFFNTLAGFIEIVYLSKTRNYFAENNKVYLAVMLEQGDKEEIAIIAIPSESLTRFYTTQAAGIQYIVFIEDIVRTQLAFIFPKWSVTGAFTLKITRDAELELQDEYEGDMAEKIEKQISKRDFGLATRLLYQPGIPLKSLNSIAAAFNLVDANIMEGGPYHQLRDLESLPLHLPGLQYSRQPPVSYNMRGYEGSLLDLIQERDILIHTPYNSYDCVLRFFNEAAIDRNVEEIWLTLYRVASDSRIIHALISAAKNGKVVTVFVELKARFDEANNIKWAKRMKTAGIRIIYSIPGLKVHAKCGLVKRKQKDRIVYTSLFSTGNLNESTARFYTDHHLLTSDHRLARELELFFIFLTKRRHPKPKDETIFTHLLVAKFNLQDKFLELIDREIRHAAAGRGAALTLKLNNLEERVLIAKLYEASNAGVKIDLLVRSVCCLIPGIAGMSENIFVRRIVDRYLEHGRVYWFHNDGNDEVWLGSADWMNRNVYRRLEVCFPVYDSALQKEILDLIRLQLEDNLAAVMVDESGRNIPVSAGEPVIRSQEAIYEYILGKNTGLAGSAVN